MNQQASRVKRPKVCHHPTIEVGILIIQILDSHLAPQLKMVVNIVVLRLILHVTQAKA